MIEPDRRDRGRHRLEHVRGVEPSAQADFTDRNLHAGAAKELECNRRGDLEKRGVKLKRAAAPQEVDNVTNVADGPGERLGGDRTSFDDESLGEIDEMRRRVPRRTVTRHAKG